LNVQEKSSVHGESRLRVAQVYCVWHKSNERSASRIDSRIAPAPAAPLLIAVSAHIIERINVNPVTPWKRGLLGVDSLP
jgi:hypothetical protein